MGSESMAGGRHTGLGDGDENADVAGLESDDTLALSNTLNPAELDGDAG